MVYIDKVVPCCVNDKITYVLDRHNIVVRQTNEKRKEELPWKLVKSSMFNKQLNVLFDLCVIR